MGIYYTTSEIWTLKGNTGESELEEASTPWITSNTNNYSYSSTHARPISSQYSWNNHTSHVPHHHHRDRLQINEAGQIISILIQLIAFFPCVIGNVTVFIVLARNRRLRTNTNIYVLSLSIADFLVGVFVIPLETTISVLELMDIVSEWLHHFCVVHQFLLVFLLGSSLTAMFLISIDRYIGISHPFFYTEKVNSKVIKRTIISGWLIMLAISTPILARLNHSKPIQICRMPTLDDLMYQEHAIGYGLSLYAIMMLIFIGNIVLYIWVARIAVIQHMRISSEIEQHQTNTRTDLKNTNVLIFMFGIFIIFWLPFMIIITIQLSDYCNLSQGNTIACTTTRTVALSFGVLNSCVNCYIYAWQKRDFKAVIRKMYCTKRRRGRITSLSAALPVLYRLRKGRTNSAESTFTVTSKVATRRTELSLIATVGYESDFRTTNDSSESRVDISRDQSFNSLRYLSKAATSRSSMSEMRNSRRVSIDTNPPQIFCTSQSRRNSGIHFTTNITEGQTAESSETACSPNNSKSATSPNNKEQTTNKDNGEGI